MSDRPTQSIFFAYMTERSMVTEIWKAWEEFPAPVTSENISRYARFG
jgi:hypothetical protein